MVLRTLFAFIIAGLLPFFASASKLCTTVVKASNSIHFPKWTQDEITRNNDHVRLRTLDWLMENSIEIYHLREFSLDLKTAHRRIEEGLEHLERVLKNRPNRLYIGMLQDNLFRIESRVEGAYSKSHLLKFIDAFDVDLNLSLHHPPELTVPASLKREDLETVRADLEILLDRVSRDEKIVSQTLEKIVDTGIEISKSHSTTPK